jgi:hypothetical protein
MAEKYASREVAVPTQPTKKSVKSGFAMLIVFRMPIFFIVVIRKAKFRH